MHPLHKSNIKDTNAYVLGVFTIDEPKPNLKSNRAPNCERNLENYIKILVFQNRTREMPLGQAQNRAPYQLQGASWNNFLSSFLYQVRTRVLARY